MALTPQRCRLEIHGPGGDGHAFVPDLRLAAERFRKTVRLAVLDRPAAANSLFQWKAGADDWLASRNTLSIPIHHNRNDGPEEYLGLLRSDVETARELLCGTGSVYVFADQRVSAHVRLMLDDMFGRGNFMNEIIWAHEAGLRPAGRFTRSHETIFLYRMGPGALFDTDAAGRERGRLKSHMRRGEEGGRAYYAREARGRTYRYYEDDIVSIGDVWTDIPEIAARDEERLGWEGQRPQSLLCRMVSASSAPGDLVCAAPSGAGTLAAVAQALERRALLVGGLPAERALARRALLLSDAALYAFESSGDLPEAAPDAAADFGDGLVTLTRYAGPSGRAAQPGSLIDDGFGSLEYWAAGRYAGGVFRMNAWSMRTKRMPALARALPAGDAEGVPCLHLADANGEQWFCTLEQTGQ